MGWPNIPQKMMVGNFPRELIALRHPRNPDVASATLKIAPVWTKRRPWAYDKVPVFKQVGTALISATVIAVLLISGDGDLRRDRNWTPWRDYNRVVRGCARKGPLNAGLVRA